MKSIFALIFTCIIFASSAFAQDNPAELDLVILKNGTRLYGTINKNTPGESLSITTEGGSEMTIKYTEVKAVVYDTNLEESEPSGGKHGRSQGPKLAKKDRPNDLPANRAYFSTGGGLNFSGLGNFSIFLPFPSIYASAGYRFGNKFILAGGLQFITQDTYAFVSAFTEVKVNFMNKSFSPYFSLKSGIELTDMSDRFFVINPTLGIRFPSRKKTHSTMYLGYMYLPTSNNWVNQSHSFSIGGGMEF